MLVKGLTGNFDILEVPRYHDMVAMKTKERAITNEKPVNSKQDVEDTSALLAAEHESVMSRDNMY